MKINRILLTLAGIVAVTSAATAQSFFDDDIYYDASKDKSTPKTSKTIRQTYSTPSTVIVAEYPSADTYTVNGTRRISIDDYNRRGIFAKDSLSNDTTATDFAYTRRIEQFYNPEIVSGSGDQELANIYYMEPERVNIYVNTPSAYWGYDYFYPHFSWYSPYWSFNWRWNSPWYWDSWHDPYWSWNWGWGPAWGPSWGWGHPGWGWGPAWGPSWGWGHPGCGPSHPVNRPNVPGYRPGNNRPAYGNNTSGIINGGRRQQIRNSNSGSYNRPSTNGRRPGVSTNSGNSNRRPNQGVTTRPSYNNNNDGYTRPSNTNGRRSSGFGNYNGGSSRGSSIGSGSYGGGGRSSGAGRSGGRGRH